MRIGTNVILSPDSIYYNSRGNSHINPINTEGVIVFVYVPPHPSDLYIKVKWANGERNHYNIIDLIDIDAIVEQELLGEDNVGYYN